MAYYNYVEMNNMQSEDIEVLENICLILNERWDYKEVEETKRMMKMFEDSEEVLAKIMSIKEIGITNRRVLAFLTLTGEEKRLGMIEAPEKWIEDLKLRMDEQSRDMFSILDAPDDTSVEMIKALAKFFLKIAVYRFCMVHWPKLIRQDKTIDKKKIKMLIEELESWERDLWISFIPEGYGENIFTERRNLISHYDETYYTESLPISRSRASSAKSWIDVAYKDCKDKVIYEDAKKLRQKYCGENVVRKDKNDSSHKRITEIENMRKLLDIMERHLSNNLTPQDISELKENMQNWEKNTEKLSEMIGNLSGL